MDIFQEILDALESEERIILATIISTSGSTPASALSKMLVKQGGIVSVGTVGGGCMEGDVLLHANRLFEKGCAEILTFTLNEDDIEHGLICGGSLDVLLEPVTRNNIPLYQELRSLRDDGEDCVVATRLNNDGTIVGKWLVRPCPSGFSGKVGMSAGELKSHIPSFRSDVEEIIEKVHHRNETSRHKLDAGELILEPIPGTPSLIIFGGGHVSKYISRAATTSGFRVTIIDDREKYANKQRFPEAVQTMALDFSQAVHHLTIKPSTYLLIVTRGHKHDELVLEQAINTSAKYIGMIGSKRKVLTTYEHLLERGISLASLKRVHSPMGIEIGAVTAEEIGISVVAELIAVRRGSASPFSHKSEEIENLVSLLVAKR